MTLIAYAQATEPRFVQLWVGVFGVSPLPPIRFRINQQDAQPIGNPALTPIRDSEPAPDGSPRNYRGIYRFAVPRAGHAYQVEILAGNERKELVTRALPEAVPPALEGSFNILLCSCYSQPEDGGGLLGAVVSQLKLEPHLTVMAGDQVYLDLPLFEDLPESEPAMSQVLGAKYKRNWASSAFGAGSLEPVLQRAPVVCIPDDHEYWNNYPFKQKQLPNTWKKKVRNRWATAAQSLYEDYQVSGQSTAARRIDVEPLKMLFVDTRSFRAANLDGHLMHADTINALARWEADLMASKPSIAVLASGQALFRDPVSRSRAEAVDAEISNYAQAAPILNALARLSNAGIPVLYLTGDVHWGRVASGFDVARQHTTLYEVIASPSRLIRVPFIGAGQDLLAEIRGIFGKRNPWPRHSEPQEVPDHLAGSKQWTLRSEFGQRGDQVAVLSFTRSGTGVDFQVTYFGIHEDRPVKATDRFSLRVA